MTLSVIGAGFGRTGTMSLKFALEQIGLGPCYHMMEVMQHSDHARLWRQATDGEDVDWPALFEGYSSAVDWPACYFWRELAAFYPDAKVILTTRDPDKWYASVKNTIYQVMIRETNGDDPERLERRAMARGLILEKVFDGRFEDRDFAIQIYQNHCQAVRETIPPARLLEYQPGEGWEPLCAFLQRPVPDADYPNVNSRSEFREHAGLEGG